jgi:NADH dehydrogenase
MAARPRIVIIGGGFGGLAAAKFLRGEPVDVTVIDRTNHHLFQPLLYQVAMAGLAPSDITVPIRWKAMPRDFRNIDTRKSRVILVEAGPRLLPAMPEPSSARRDLERLGVEVRTGAAVTGVDAHGARIGNGLIRASNVFWAAGNQASPLGAMLGGPVDCAGRVLVGDDLSVPGRPEVFVAGDLAAVRRADGSLVPGVAPAAMQEGRRAADNALRIVNGETTNPFRYYNKGDLATIGRNRAIAVFGRFEVAGYPAWLLWLFVHILYLVGFRNRLSVLMQWAYAYFTFQRGVRLITAAERAAPAVAGPGDRP